MVEDRNAETPIQQRDPSDPAFPPGRSRGSLIIFVLVAMALILAIGFFYMTRDQNDRPADALTEAADAPDSAAQVVGDAARSAADTLRNHN